MAALRPCPSGLTTPASSNSRLKSWPPRIILPPGRRNTMLMLPRMQTCNQGHGIRAHKGAADQSVNPDPDENMSADYKKFLEAMRKLAKGPPSADYKKILEAMWKLAKGPPDMPFREELDRIDEYSKKISHTSILHLEATTLSGYLCVMARMAVRFASKVMDCAVIRLGTPGEISLHTIKQTVKMYVCIFVSTAEDSYHKKVTKETIVSFLGALQGVAAISHILVQDTLANLIDNKDGSWNYSPDCDVDRARLEYQGKMNSLKDKFMRARSADAYEILRPTLTDAVLLTKYFVIKMIANRKRALGHVPGPTRAPDDGETEK